MPRILSKYDNPSHTLDMVTLFSSSNHDAEMEANAIHGVLEANGIPSIVVGASQIHGHSNFRCRCPGRISRTPSACSTKPRPPAPPPPSRPSKLARTEPLKSSHWVSISTLLPVGADRNRSHLIRPEYLNICLPQPFEYIGVRMPVKIFEARRDDGERRMHGFEKRLGGRRLAAVMRHFQDVAGATSVCRHQLRIRSAARRLRSRWPNALRRSAAGPANRYFVAPEAGDVVRGGREHFEPGAAIVELPCPWSGA